jgi:hypothetical protein
VILEDLDNGLSGVMRELLAEIGERLRFIDERLRKYDLTILRLFRDDERCQRVAAVEGVGPVTATALVAAVGNATDFKSGRELAAYLVPRHRATGSSDTAARAPAGRPGSSFVAVPMWRQWHWRTRMPECCGRCSAEGRAIDQRRFPPASCRFSKPGPRHLASLRL